MLNKLAHKLGFITADELRVEKASLELTEQELNEKLNGEQTLLRIAKITNNIKGAVNGSTHSK